MGYIPHFPKNANQRKHESKETGKWLVKIRSRS